MSRLYDTDPDFYNATFLQLLVVLNEHFNYRFRSILDPHIENLQAAVAAAAVRSLAWSPERTETPIRLSLDRFVPHTGHLVPGPDGWAVIVTPSTAWAYAATLRLPTVKVRGKKDRRGYACIRVRAEGAAIGIGVLHRNGDHFIDRCSLEPSEVESEIRLGIPRLKEASDLIVQTWARAESGTVHIESVELVMFAKSSAGPSLDAAAE